MPAHRTSAPRSTMPEEGRYMPIDDDQCVRCRGALYSAPDGLVPLLRCACGHEVQAGAITALASAARPTTAQDQKEQR